MVSLKGVNKIKISAMIVPVNGHISAYFALTDGVSIIVIIVLVRYMFLEHIVALFLCCITSIIKVKPLTHRSYALRNKRSTRC